MRSCWVAVRFAWLSNVLMEKLRTAGRLFQLLQLEQMGYMLKTWIVLRNNHLV